MRRMMKRRDFLSVPVALLAAAAGPAGAAPPPEDRRLIEALIERVEKDSRLKFLRNGQQHDNVEAGQHLRAKYAHYEDRIRTVEDFIDLCATRSEMTRQRYQVRDAAGVLHDANAFMRGELQRLRRAGTASPPSR